ncbi:hypothetical protein C2G38_2217449 [Gigaspora rosea]|uniref:Uncharacterized protein n=1 Tax=Gigaspora rosea TaxID=44941 RepID=A0A397UG84_9GLOM|nr:hypothetical protein C2G38_2217449 [Gigaspora rosea]
MNFNDCDDDSKTRISAYGRKALDSPETTELGSEDVRALSEAPYKTFALTYLNHSLYPSQAHYFFNINRLATTSNDDLYESGRADEPGSEQGKALAETFCNNTTLTSVSHYYLPMNDILESTVPTYHLSEPIFDNQQDIYNSQLQIEHSNVFELSDSSSQSESDIDDHFKTFEQIRKKLDRYAMECGFAVRKGHTHPDDQRNRDVIVTGSK